MNKTLLSRSAVAFCAIALGSLLFAGTLTGIGQAAETTAAPFAFNLPAQPPVTESITATSGTEGTTEEAESTPTTTQATEAPAISSTPNLAPTDTPSPSATLSPTPTDAPSPSATPNLAPTDAPSPTPAPSLSQRFIQFISSGVGLVLFVVIVVVAIVIFSMLLFQVFRKPPEAPVLQAPPGGPWLDLSGHPLPLSPEQLERNGVVVGRAADAGLRIDDKYPNWETVAERHARIYRDNRGHIIVEDLNSPTGVYVNGRRAPRLNMLQDGWKLGIGKVEFTFHLGQPG